MLRTKRKRHKLERSWYHSCKRDVKWHSNLMTRTRNRAQVHKIMRNPGHEYDPSHDRFKKMLWWVYD